jgi:hypothetical protein
VWVRVVRRIPRVARAGWVRVRACWAMAVVESAPQSTGVSFQLCKPEVHQDRSVLLAARRGIT